MFEDGGIGVAIPDRKPWTCSEPPYPSWNIELPCSKRDFALGVPPEVGTQQAIVQYSLHSGLSASAINSTKDPTCWGSHRAPLRFIRTFTRCLIVPSTNPLPIAWP